MNFAQLRKKHPSLVYESFEWSRKASNLEIKFHFTLMPGIHFEPTIVFPNISQEPKELENLIFNLGIVELLSYWKAACPPEIIIKTGCLDKNQVNFWQKLLIKGLGEFFYTNKINFSQKDLVKFKVIGKNRFNKLSNSLKDRDLIFVGGGKDSAVTLETISESGKEFNCLFLNPTKAALNISAVGGCKKPIVIRRTLDPKLLDLNKRGYLNGHTPFSAYLAFLGILAGHIYNYKNLVVSNEKSSDEINTLWNGAEINHQYSKTSEFEKDFRKYSQKYLSKSANYYSFIRKFGEMEISEKFAKLIKYHHLFLSCNKGSKENKWCGQCPKCLSTYLTLYPFLGSETKGIFGKDLLNDESLKPTLKGLLRENDTVKPFECVATVDEIKKAIGLGRKKAKHEGQEIPKLLKDESILILGFGREGKTTLKFLKKHHPEKKIDIADKKDGKAYLSKIKNFDAIIKSPGIPYLPEIQQARDTGKVISSATNIFFENFKGKIIGVTGTKGKSTTVSLIYEVLKKGDLDVYLVGNIGKPALELLDKLGENSIVVYELSSFQLADITKSPQIAVITNIYPEHLDWHGSFDNYKRAKENIFKFQAKDDILIKNKSGADAAKIVGKLFHIPNAVIEKAIKDFKGLPHRLEFVGQFRGIKFYNDSLATIPQATIRALDTLKNVETLIAGGFDRGIDYSILGPAISKSNVKNLILFPTTGEKIAKSISKKIKKFNVNNMKEAVKIAFEVTSQGKIVLLSPSSASFNLFKNYEDRGEQFKTEVLSYKQ